ncbi:hypothetical protein ACLOJK_034775 [Asimina triloba]
MEATTHLEEGSSSPIPKKEESRKRESVPRGEGQLKPKSAPPEHQIRCSIIFPNKLLAQPTSGEALID